MDFLNRTDVNTEIEFCTSNSVVDVLGIVVFEKEEVVTDIPV